MTRKHSRDTPLLSSQRNTTEVYEAEPCTSNVYLPYAHCRRSGHTLHPFSSPCCFLWLQIVLPTAVCLDMVCLQAVFLCVGPSVTHFIYLHLYLSLSLSLLLSPAHSSCLSLPVFLCLSLSLSLSTALITVSYYLSLFFFTSLSPLSLCFVVVFTLSLFGPSLPTSNPSRASLFV